jgi:hypothetical protein
MVSRQLLLLYQEIYQLNGDLKAGVCGLGGLISCMGKIQVTLGLMVCRYFAGVA